jgi:methionine synthase II (cobalamin-independent)
MIDKDTLIEDLVRELPQAVRYLKQHNIKCLECGEPIWGTLAEAAREKGYTDDDIAKFVDELNRLAGSQT